MSAITLVKSDRLQILKNEETHIEVDLGIGMYEAARILGVSFNVSLSTMPSATQFCDIKAAYSFDPEDEHIVETDDEQFAHCELIDVFIFTQTEGIAVKSTQAYFLDFTRMNLVTTRNLAFLLNAKGTTGSCVGRVYYERFKPSANDLNQLIAWRR
ncbi:hypothetical protein ES705_43707 [subsurface metagenome]